MTTWDRPQENPQMFTAMYETFQIVKHSFHFRGAMCVYLSVCYIVFSVERLSSEDYTSF